MPRDRSIEILKLNDEGTCIKSRQRYVELYCQRRVDFEFLREEAPFIAMEIQRQGLKSSVRRIMGFD